MQRLGFFITSAAVGAVLVAATAFAASKFGADSAREAAVSVPQITAPQSNARQWYPQGRYPTLALPGGREETVRSVLNVRSAMKYGDFIWDEEGVPDGPVWVRADLDKQIISVFRGGHEIGTAVLLYGADSKPTPAGVFPVLQKDADYHSRTYDAPMPFMLRLTDDFVAIHASDVRAMAATHGCIGVPMEFARKLFDQMQIGDEVFVLKTA
ncbi:MAG TPA: L,D-transpeptidase family protein [Croceibacterium sp.]|nr:L,D-transpeptidase family protein [Croceibacterium sp.]